jgi:hypothetical protein
LDPQAVPYPMSAESNASAIIGSNNIQSARSYTSESTYSDVGSKSNNKGYVLNSFQDSHPTAPSALFESLKDVLYVNPVMSSYLMSVYPEFNFTDLINRLAEITQENRLSSTSNHNPSGQNKSHHADIATISQLFWVMSFCCFFSACDDRFCSEDCLEQLYCKSLNKIFRFYFCFYFNR